MGLTWIHENPPHWDDAKARIVGGAPQGIFTPAAFGAMTPGALVPGEWWRVDSDGRTVGYGWMDTTWGDAEILLVVEPGRQRHGVGSFILDHLAAEARQRNLNYLFNEIPPSHPDAAGLGAWLRKRGFAPDENGRQLRAPSRAR